MDKTFAEFRNHKPFDWNLFLANPPALNSSEHSRATDLASNWVTCACGNQCAIIPRDPSEPNDFALRMLGMAFSGDINRADWPEARDTLAAIEARSAVLIQEELAKLNQ